MVASRSLVLRLVALTLLATNVVVGFTLAPHSAIGAPKLTTLPNRWSGNAPARILKTAQYSPSQLMTSMSSDRNFPALNSTTTDLSSATTADDLDLTATHTTEAAVSTDKPSFPIVLWRFSRPHTLIGSALAIPALHILAADSLQAAFTVQTAQAALYAMVPSLLMNLYITGLNQITDVEIDKINKPDLPIAAGILSKPTAIWTVVIALVASLIMGVASPVYSTQGLNVALWGSGILGTLYSLEPARLKRFPLLAAFCIVAVRGTIINAGFFAHARQAAFGDAGATVWNCLLTNTKCFRSSLFFAVFGVVIALMKDVPDVKGDQQSNVRTFSVRIGQKRIFHAMRRLLSGLFVGVSVGFIRAVPAATDRVTALCRGVTAAVSLVAAWSVRKEAENVDPEDSKQVYSFYMHLWKLFYLSYLVLPFAR